MIELRAGLALDEHAPLGGGLGRVVVLAVSRNARPPARRTRRHRRLPLRAKSARSEKICIRGSAPARPIACGRSASGAEGRGAGGLDSHNIYYGTKKDDAPGFSSGGTRRTAPGLADFADVVERPLMQAMKRRGQRPAERGDRIFQRDWRGRKNGSRNQAVALQRLQSLREHLLRYAFNPAPQFVEAHRLVANEDERQKRPFVPNPVEHHPGSGSWRCTDLAGAGRGVAGVTRCPTGADAVISSVHFSASDPKLLIEAVRDSGVKRYFVVGGAGSLEVAPGMKLIDTPQFPAAYKAEAAKGGEFLDLLRRETALDWTFLSPSAMVGPGERTGKFRLGKDQLLTNDKGSSISWEDYAIAAVDELEKPAHVRQRFTVGY